MLIQTLISGVTPIHCNILLTVLNYRTQSSVITAQLVIKFAKKKKTFKSDANILRVLCQQNPAVIVKQETWKRKLDRKCRACIGLVIGKCGNSEC